MTGPCLCGDIYCPRCGNPAQAAYGDACADAADAMIEELNKAELSPEEYRIVTAIGLAAVLETRKAATRAIEQLQNAQAEAEAEAKALASEAAYWEGVKNAGQQD